MNVNKSLKLIIVKLWLLAKMPVPFSKERTDKFILILVLWAYKHRQVYYSLCTRRMSEEQQSSSWLSVCKYKKILITELPGVWHCDLLSCYRNKAWPSPYIICGTSEREPIHQDTCICLWAFFKNQFLVITEVALGILKIKSSKLYQKISTTKFFFGRAGILILKFLLTRYRP